MAKTLPLNHNTDLCSYMHLIEPKEPRYQKIHSYYAHTLEDTLSTFGVLTHAEAMVAMSSKQLIKSDFFLMLPIATRMSHRGGVRKAM